MEVNSGKSSNHSSSGRFSFKHYTSTIMECITIKQKGPQTGQVYSSFHSSRNTLQFQGSIAEIAIPFIRFSHFNHFQRRHILNLTHRIIYEGPNANPQFSQSLTILQIEMTIRILHKTAAKAVSSHHHSFQSVQSYQLHFIDI